MRAAQTIALMKCFTIPMELTTSFMKLTQDALLRSAPIEEKAILEEEELAQAGPAVRWWDEHPPLNQTSVFLWQEDK